MDTINNNFYLLKKIGKYFLPVTSAIIPYISGIIFIDAFSKYYFIRKCEIVDASTINICSIIKFNYIAMINLAGIIFVISAIFFIIIKKFHKLNYTQINFMYLCIFSFLIKDYIKPELMIMIFGCILMLTYFTFIKFKFNIKILDLTIIFLFIISLIYPFARGFKDFVYYYTEDKWISFSDFPKDGTGQEVWTKDIQMLLIGIKELELKEFSSIGIGNSTFIDVAAWPIRHKRNSRWVVHKKNEMGDKCELKWTLDGVNISFC